jgi:hypothetical protein
VSVEPEDQLRPYDVLRDILADVNSWLHFAEAKNAALVAANLAIATALAAALVTADSLSVWTAAGIFAVAGSVLIGGIIALTSFFAKLQPPHIGDDKAFDSGNVLFYGHIAKMSPDYFLRKLRSQIGQNGKGTGVEKDLASQIRTNSSIALAKFTRFNFALRVSICGLALPSIIAVTGEVFL